MGWLLYLLILLQIARGAKECLQHFHTDRYGTKQITCLCNEDYCDSLDTVAPLPDDQAYIYITSKAGKRMNRTIAKFRTGNERSTPILTVYPTELKQQMKGFGGTFTDGAMLNIDNLPSKARKNLLESLFGPSGMQYSLGRVPIGSNDFSTRPYTYDDWDDDVQLLNFTLMDEDISHRGAGALLHELNRTDYWKIYANYMLRYFEEYSKHGINFTMVSSQNEPNLSKSPNFPWQAMFFTPNMLVEWVQKYLGPALRTNNATKNLELLSLEMSREQLEEYSKALLADDRAKNFSSGIGLHWYADDKIDASILRKTVTEWGGRYVIYTESANGWLTNDVILGSWDRAENYVKSIMEVVNNGGAGWIDYNLCVDMNGGPSWIGNNMDAAIVVDKQNRSFLKQPMLYAVGHFSKFVRPGADYMASRFSPNQDLPQIHHAAFVNKDGSRVLVLYNSDSEQECNISVIDDSRSSGLLPVTLPPSSIATVLWGFNTRPAVSEAQMSPAKEDIEDQDAATLEREEIVATTTVGNLSPILSSYFQFPIILSIIIRVLI
ncbi:unnamed protein product, partial [Mesorhabditis spiculigera]